MKYGLPTLAVTAVGKEMTRDARYLGMACRVCAELGAQFVKTYYCEPDFEQVTSACPVPIVIAGGKKIPEPDALKLAYMAIDQGAAGVDMGRNIFAAVNPVAMLQAVRAVVHDLEKPDKALDLYETLKNEA
jgi:putative autoinducer-2 (AI-2) aldolase